MVSSIMVPEEVRRLFQVLTGEDMTDADEGVLFAVADALESGAVGVGEVGVVAELVGKVRTEFSGKAADRFAEGLEVFDGLLASGQGALGELAVFVRELARQVRYLKLVTIYGLELLAFEMAWAMAWAGATGGASMAWLAARMAVMRLLLSRWWGQLFMRLAMAAAGGVAFNVVPDLQAQVQMLGEKSSAKWDGKLSEQAAGMGAFSALVSLPLSAVGGLVSNALTKVLVRGLGDEVDEKILEAAARKAVDKHAELYPVSAMARFADVVGDHLDVYAGMSVRGMWSARFGSGIGEALSEGLGELFGEVGYQAATGQEVTWNPFSVTAGVFESVFSGVGNLAGLVWRGKLHPEGPSPYLDDTSRGMRAPPPRPPMAAGSVRRRPRCRGRVRVADRATPGSRTRTARSPRPMARMARKPSGVDMFSRSGRWIRLRCRCPPAKTPWCPLLWTARTSRAAFTLRAVRGCRWQRAGRKADSWCSRDARS
ncbi:hypothetical protein [Saccharopolyspora spinosa]|uniref:WXG100-like domain-containing protein n=1 Tax=Saccharopolyspora spinosa TaxID=60894 RepID=UPI00376F259F